MEIWVYFGLSMEDSPKRTTAGWVRCYPNYHQPLTGWDAALGSIQAASISSDFLVHGLGWSDLLLWAPRIPLKSLFFHPKCTQLQGRGSWGRQAEPLRFLHCSQPRPGDVHSLYRGCSALMWHLSSTRSTSIYPQML